jgi:hypothetical protein
MGIKEFGNMLEKYGSRLIVQFAEECVLLSSLF